MKRTAVYPGSFDPLTLGHLDLIERSATIFPQVIVAVAAITSKATAMFDVEERAAMAREAVSHLPNVRVALLDGLLVEFCRLQEVNVVIRGLRAYSDFEYEFQMALTNRKMAPEVETLFMMPQEEHSYVTASTVRELARYGVDTGAFVPACVQRHISEFMRRNPEQRLAAQGGRAGGSGAFDR
ncbi:MAG: pantetheine-phosphate adenylyltransferase [Kiritimatiellae bacterium]|nr:pantetheine-phosphate adenylyltransferase [Kiritimatiellia bacterium]